MIETKKAGLYGVVRQVCMPELETVPRIPIVFLLVSNYLTYLPMILPAHYPGKVTAVEDI